MKCGNEIESKYLVNSLPNDLEDKSRVQHIKQTYVYLSDCLDVRVREVAEGETVKYFYTTKLYKYNLIGIVEEFESEIDRETYNNLLFNKNDGTITISKTRYKYPIPGGLVAEVDIYEEELYPLEVAEVEFYSLEEKDSFTPPLWFGQDVTKDENYKNRNLCKVNNMKKDLTLVIMAAGMGSRFGGLKQIEPVGPNGEFIIDYSIFDAVKCGFNKVVFIIKEENYEVFKSTIGKRIESIVKVEYVFQNNELLPSEIKDKRVKPLGTAHAILCSKEAVNESFIVINADDFYGRDAFRVASEFLNNSTNEDEYAVIGYQAENTITENGSVKRGICESKNDYLTKIIESSISYDNDILVASPLNGSDSFVVEKDKTVSMNFFAFKPKLFKYLETELEEFLKNGDLLKDEFLLPDVVCKKIESKEVKVKVLNTSAIWHGMTYKEDKQQLVDEISKMIESGIYPSKI